eukprot:Gb_13606 [translate_table: standard]
MVVTKPLWNRRKKKMALSLRSLIHFHSTKAPPNTNSSALQGEERFGNVNNSFSAMDVGDNVRTMCKHSQLKDALHSLYSMKNPESSTYYVSLLQGCANQKALPEGKLVHAHIIYAGFTPDIILGNTLVIMYTKCRSLGNARRFFEEMAVRNVVSWTLMISAYARHGCSEEALTLFFQMQRTGIQPDQFAFASVLPACANLEALENGKEVHEFIIRRGFQSNVIVGSALVDMYVKCGSIENARKLFDGMPERNVVSWTAMIVGYAQNALVDEALKLFHKVPQRNVVTWNAMIAAYAQNGLLHEAMKLFQEMPQRDVISWTSMIAGYLHNGNFDEALELFQKMPERDVVSWNLMIAGYAQNGRIDEALKLFQVMPEQNVLSWNALIAGYAQDGNTDEAQKLFQIMPERNVASWNAMIAGYAQNGHFDKSLKLFQQMQLADVKRDVGTFARVLPACANLAALEHGKEVHSDIIRCGFQFDGFVGSALVDMYAKCGSIWNARQVFDKMPRPDVVSWNAMIGGYAMHGCGKEALQLFEKMQHSSTNPNHVTFIGILSACSHSGLVDNGREYFDRMSREYHITPAMEHYCCMVDLLGRAGCLDEVEDFVNKMPIKPGAAVWASLLSACRVHMNIELGERVAEHLFESDPKNAAHYVLLSNIYAAAGRWNEVEKVRKMMKDRMVTKMPGRSWIEVNNKVYAFLGGDRSHPQTQEIYVKLETLFGQIKEAGYVPNTNLVLHDVEGEQKERILRHHSEKLAIAFGLINTMPGMPIQIVKNLRVCSDCHSATKFISKIVVREIVVRDANRFHHFKDGECSCGDYW